MKLTINATERNCRALQAYGDQKRNAKRRGHTFDLTFAEWQWLWLSSGHWEKRGTGKGQYVMSRKGDKGPYAVGNVFFQRTEDNVAQGQALKAKTYRFETCACGQEVRVNVKWRHLRKCPAVRN